MMFKKRNKGKNLKKWLIVIFTIAVIVPLIWIVVVKFEGEKPVIDLNLASAVVPADFEITGNVDDGKSGLKRLWIGILQDGKETVLFDEAYPSDGYFGKGTVRRVPIAQQVNAKKLNLSDGPAKLRIAAWDYAWRNWWGGNQAYLEKEIVFDTRAPVLSVLSTQHNVTRGGAGLVIYKLSEKCPHSGVLVGEDFFPGYPGHFNDTSIYLAFFAIPVDYEKQGDIFVRAVDAAGNESKSGFYYHLREKKFKTDTINISENFLNMKLPEFQSVEGVPSEKSPEDQFIFINGELRKRNNHTILSNGQKTENRLFWQDFFGRLPNSARRANFGDQRVYTHNGNVVSNAVHMGIDLASVKHAEIPAANRGKIVFADYVGIYGNLVCIDHGCGLMSIYAHLSRMTVGKDELVERGDIIGYTGTTGLAGGDHLHFGMFIDHVFVNPVEWWDSSWIYNNITSKIESVQAMAQ